MTDIALYCDKLDPNTKSAIERFAKRPFAEGEKIRMMPDAHIAKFAIVGTTMSVKNRICPSVVGNDIGCGVLLLKLKKGEMNFEKLTKAIQFSRMPLLSSKEIQSTFTEKFIVKHLGERADYPSKGGLFSIGGGNHFIEVDAGPGNERYLAIHTGSRFLSDRVSTYFQRKAFEKHPEDVFEFSWLDGNDVDEYIEDVTACCRFAALNRKALAMTLCRAMKWKIEGEIDTPHNFVTDGILRKGAVSAKDGEIFSLPLNMKEGILLCKGRGNPAWNYSAPHGAGRLFSRQEAKNRFTLTEFKKEMQGIYSPSVSRATIDECPMAYKKPEAVLNYLPQTADILLQLIPLFNYKESE